MERQILIVVLIGCVLGMAVILFVSIRRTKKTMDTIEDMLAAAVKGNFSETDFDETRLSALETKFAHYFLASVVSAQNVSVEREKIKTLISDISHQTKTPVANLLLYSELLGEEELGESAAGDVRMIHAQAEKLRFLIDSLVKLSRLESGILQLAPRREPLQPMLVAAVEQLSAKAEEKRLELCLHPTGAEACFDPKWTLEAVCNLLDNAVKYTGCGGVEISVVTYEMFVRIDIKDTGIGIAEDEQAKIFTRFYRSRSAGDSEGVGIGLYLAREIISGEGGYIKVSSVRGQGSIFSIFLPSGANLSIL